jgi:hypothetical protein
MLKGNNFGKMVVVGTSIAPRSLNLSTANGVAIVEPWRTGRQVSFLLLGGDFPGTTVLAINLQVRLRGTSSWVNLKKANGVTDIILSGTKFNDGGAMENGVLLAGLDVNRIPSDIYDAVRVNITNTVATAAFIAVAHVISDLYAEPSSQVDETAGFQTP